MKPARQLTLAFDHRPSLDGDDFLVAPCNAEAVSWIDRWPDWPAPALVIHGPAGCGKTHLAQVFLARTGGRAVATTELAGLDPVRLAEEAPAVALPELGGELDGRAEEALFHLLNATRAAGRRVLMTARAPAARWPVALPDLRSRLLAAAAAEIGPPDDALLGAVLVKQLRDRQLAVDAPVVAYATARLERSFEAVRRFVDQADRAALAEGRPITVPFARRLLGGEE